ncbi:MAG: 4-(cytidine 5'-diphospho)-2-C-methyl-D-erythritol kinase [Tepidisphaeraceae bacterium]|jgi:4-diphosphocytidyl-2-C-methyl-D-erythritol kinase
MRLLSPAKINLHLRVGKTAPDGFHPLMSWFCTVGLFDTIEMTRTADGKMSLVCDVPEVPTDASNLIIRAGLATLEQYREQYGAKISLSKKIPMGGGLGGGSSNAATALRGFNQIWDLRFTADRMARLAAKLGSDVSFFLHGPSSVCTGRGQNVAPINSPRVRWAVLIFPAIPISTPKVYKRFDELNLGSTQAIEHQPDWKTWTNLRAEQLLPLLINDLEAPAFDLFPELAGLRENIEKSLSRIVRMSGSGSTLFTLADDQTTAEKIAARIQKDFVPAAAVELSPITSA